MLYFSPDLEELWKREESKNSGPRGQKPQLFLLCQPREENREIACDGKGRGKEATTKRKPLTRHTSGKES